MLERALDTFADVVTRRRGAVVAIGLGVTVLCASQIPHLEGDSSPEELMISQAGYREAAREFRAHFGDTDSIVAILVAADDVTTQPVLAYVHALTLHFRDTSSVERVESITVTPLPSATTSETERLDDLGDEPAADRAEIEAVLERLVSSEPDRFPLGLVSIADRVGDRSTTIDGVVRGDVVTDEDAATIARALDDAPLVVGRLVSRDRQLTAVVLFMAPDLGTGSRRIDAVHEIDDWLAASPPPSGVSLHVAGIPHLRAAIRDAMIEDQLFLVPLALVLCVVLLYVSFRWVAGVVLPIAMVAMTVVCVLGGMAFFGEPLSILMNTLPTLLVIMGIAEAVHVVGRYVEESRRTQRRPPLPGSNDRVDAARRAIRGLMIACFLTSFTTAVGFGALFVAQTEMLRHFGVTAAIGVMVGYVLLITFVPAAISYFPAPPGTRAPGSGAEGPSRRTRRRWLEGMLVRVTATIARRPLAIVLATLLVMVPCGWAYASIHVDTALLETFDDDDEVAVSTRLVERHLDGILPLEVHVTATGATDVRDPRVIEALDRVAAWAREEPGVLRTSTPGDVLWAVWRPIAGVSASGPRTSFRSRDQVEALITLLDGMEPSPMLAWMTPDGRHARMEIRLADVGARRSVELIHAIEARTAAELAPIGGLEVVLVGEALIGSHGVTAVVDDLFGSLGLSALVIFFTIGLLFRSARLGALAIPPNVIPQIGTVAWMVLRGIPLNAGTAIVFSVAIGVSVDLTIHGFARLVEEEARGLTRRAALVRVARSTGRAIVLSCATLVLGFSVLLFSGFVPIRHFGELIAVALSLSLVTTLVFQPAMWMLLAGPPRARR